jgi:hypothetical protein
LDEWRAWFASWRLTLDVRGRRPHTIAFYERELLRFAAHVGSRPLLITKTIVRRCLRNMIDAGPSPTPSTRLGGGDVVLLAGRGG